MNRQLIGMLLVTAVACTPAKQVPKPVRTTVASPSPSSSSTTVRSLDPSTAQASPSSIPKAVTKGAPLEPKAPLPAKAGDYFYDETGFQRVSGCFTSERPPPTPTKMKVGEPDGSRQQIERDRRDTQGRGTISTAIIEYRADGVYLVYLRQMQTGLVTSSIEFEPKSPVLVVPNDPKAGRAWNFTLTSKDGRVVVESSNIVQEALDKTITIASNSTVKGNSDEGTIDIKITTTSTYSREIRLATKEETQTHGTVGLCQIDAEERAILR